MKTFFKIAVIVSLTISLFSCTTDDEMLTYNTDIVSIEYGTSFGQCLGYCNRNIIISGTEVQFQASGQTITGNLPDLTIPGEITVKEWESLVKTINLLIFRNMEEVIGCPDCADGGAEWIEITTDEISHKIVFEFDNAPEEVENLIEELREILEQYETNMN